MTILYPLASIAVESTGKTIDRLNFSRNRISSRQLMLLVFCAMSTSLLAFIILMRQPLPEFSLISIALLCLISIVSFGANVFDFFSLKSNGLALREPINNFEIILAGLVGYIVFPSERNSIFLLAFFASGIIVYWGTGGKHLDDLQKKGVRFYLISNLFYALLPSIYKITLEHVSPEYISFFRVTSILILTTIFFPIKRIGKFSKQRVRYALMSGIVYSIGSVVGLYAISTFGVVQMTTLMLMGPGIRFLSGHFILKEKIKKEQIISSSLLSIVALITLFI